MRWMRLSIQLNILFITETSDFWPLTPLNIQPVLSKNNIISVKKRKNSRIIIILELSQEEKSNAGHNTV